MTPFNALYGYDLDLRIDIRPKDSVIKGEVPATYDQITRLTELRQ